MYCTTFSSHGENEKIEFRKHFQQDRFDIEQWHLDAFLYLFDVK